jgi:hypothetical protein
LLQLPWNVGFDSCYHSIRIVDSCQYPIVSNSDISSRPMKYGYNPRKRKAVAHPAEAELIGIRRGFPDFFAGKGLQCQVLPTGTVLARPMGK